MEGWLVMDGLLLFKGKIFVLEASSVWPLTLADAHDFSDEGIEKTLHHWRASFYSPCALRQILGFCAGLLYLPTE
jgi:hypothetical protein